MLSTPEGYERMTSVIPLKRMCTPKDVGAAVCYLASDEASFITGVNLPVRTIFGSLLEL